MKYLLIVLTLSLMGCGMAEDITRGCKGDLDTLCDMIFGRDSEEIDKVAETVEENSQSIENIENQIQFLNNMVNLMTAQINSLETDIFVLSNTQQNNTTVINTLQNNQNALQNQLNTVVADLAALEAQDTVVDYVDPCGDGPGFDEIIMKTSSGKYVAYFQSGNGNNQKRHLTILTPGNYRTTDQQQCNFSVLANGTIQ